MMRRLLALVLLTGCATTQMAADLEANQRAMRGALVGAEPAAYRPEYRQAVIDGRVVVGMTQREALTAWGDPVDINRTTVESGTREQYVYRQHEGNGRYRARYFYVENGRVVAVQD